MKNRNPANNMTMGRLIRSVAAWSAVSASASSWVRNEAALAASDARTFAPSVPARLTDAASSDSSPIPSSVPSLPRADHGVSRARRAPSSARRSQGERPAVADARRVAEGGLDPATAGQRDDDQVQERAEGVAEVPPPASRVGADAEVGKDEPADHQDE